jgi:F-type H+-transporting ATPase subunit b
MLIDWFTVGAQALNFLVLVWLMKRFLYKPVLNAIDAREKRIAGELADAASAEGSRPRRSARSSSRSRRSSSSSARRLLKKATDEAETERRAAARCSQKGGRRPRRAARQEALKTEAQALGQALRRTEQEVFAIARKALADLATTSLEERLGEVFTRRLARDQRSEKARRSPRRSRRPRRRSCAAPSTCPRRSAPRSRTRSTRRSRPTSIVRFETAPELGLRDRARHDGAEGGMEHR